MKKTFYYFVALMLIGGFIYSCQDDDADINPKNISFTAIYENQPFPLSTKEDLATFIKTKIENDQVKITEASFEEVQYELGKFYLVRGKYENEGLITSITISLTELEKAPHDSHIGVMMLGGGCTMTCTPAANCTSCQQTITTPCKSQTCDCNSGSGGCTASTTFPNDEK